MPAELGHARLHASRYVYYALIHIDIRTLNIKIKIWCPRAACAHARSGGPDERARALGLMVRYN